MADDTPPQPPTPTPAPAAASKRTGAFSVYTATRDGEALEDRDPSNPQAVELYISPEADGRPTDDQTKLLDDLAYVHEVVQRLYLDDGLRPSGTKFRRYYVRLFRLAQIGLEDPDPAPKQARSTLDALKASLIEDEGFDVKTRNITKLAETALLLALPLAIAYFVLKVFDGGDIDRLLSDLNIQRNTLANFLILWIGCFTGVCLSYGVRTTTLTLADLISAGPDRLAPSVRLLFIGTLTMLFGMLFISGIVELKLGSHSTAEIATDPAIAFIIGTFFGLSEAALPGITGKRVEGFMKGLQ